MKTTFRSPYKAYLTGVVCVLFSHELAVMYADSLTHGVEHKSLLLRAEVFDPTDSTDVLIISSLQPCSKSKSRKGKIV